MSNDESKLQGVIVPIITPVFKTTTGYVVDEVSLIKLVGKICEANVFGIFVLGNAGGFQFLTMEMKNKVIDIVSGKTNMFVGVSDKNIENSVILTTYAKEKGALGVVILPGYENDWENIFEVNDMPIIFYNNPHICDGNGLGVEIIKAAMKKYPGRIMAIKESSGDRKLFLEFIKLQMETGLPIFQGDATSLVWAKELEKEIIGYKLAGAVPVHASVEAKNYVGFLENPDKYAEAINSYVKGFPSIRATIEELVKREMVNLDTLKFWDEFHI